MSDMNEKVRWKNTSYFVDVRTREQLLEVEHVMERSLVMYQGSWARGSLSAETHAGAGAADLGTDGSWWELETVCRKVGMAAWYRHTGTWTNNRHVHALSIGNPYLAPWAKKQVGAYKAGYNGLGPNARSGRDDGVRSYINVTWEEYMPSAKDIIDEMVKQAPAIGKGFAKGFLGADDIIAAGKGEADTANKFQTPKTFVTNDHDLLYDLRELLGKIAEKATTP